MGGETHYEVLGVARTADRVAIRQAYTRRAREVHPDKGGDARLFARLQLAYEVLSTDKLRHVYDQLHPPAATNTPWWQHSVSTQNRAPASPQQPEPKQASATPQPQTAPATPFPPRAAAATNPAPAPGLATATACVDDGWWSDDGDNDHGKAEQCTRAPYPQPAAKDSDHPTALNPRNPCTAGATPAPSGPTPHQQAPLGPHALPADLVTDTAALHPSSPRTSSSASCSASSGSEAGSEPGGSSGGGGLPSPPPAAGPCPCPPVVYQAPAGQGAAGSLHEHAAGAEPGQVAGQCEALLLEVLHSRGVVCDAATQLVVTCEVCRRPATQRCWTCSADICEFCVRTPHAKGEVALHWPLINKPGSLLDRLGQQEFERKRLADAEEYEKKQPGYKSAAQRAAIRTFQAAAARAATLPHTKTSYHPSLARFYQWTQTQSALYVAVHLPEGAEGRPMQADVDPSGLLTVWSKLQGPPSTSTPSTRTPCGRFACLVLPKGSPGLAWPCLFKGDSDGARSVGVGGPPLYTTTREADEVLLEVELPSWTVSRDVACAFSPSGLSLAVVGVMKLQRTFAAGLQVDPAQCSWTLTELPAAGRRQAAAVTASTPAARKPLKLLSVTLVCEEVQGERAGNGHGLAGGAVFAEDVDEFGLTPLLRVHSPGP
ncbi:hypothetical protein V8C86DRAFT_1811078 [Haematococcus lacustris]